MALCEKPENDHFNMMRSSACSSPPPPYATTVQSSAQFPSELRLSDHQSRSLQYQEYFPPSQQYHIQSTIQNNQQLESSIPCNPPQYASPEELSAVHSVALPNNQAYILNAQPVAQKQVSQLPRPCVIPQITKVFGGVHMSPFVRARAPELEYQYGISSAELLTFIDELNESFLANPALRAVGAAGNIVSFVPLASTQIAGGAISLAAGLGAAGVSFVRTKRYMKKANQNIFKPKGLHAQICKTDKMLNHIGMANNGAVFAGTQSRAVLEDTLVEDGDNPISRRMQVLDDHTVKISFDGLNAPVAPDNWIKKVGAYSAQRAELKQLEKLNKEQAKSEKKTTKHERKASKAQRKQDKADEKVEHIMEEMDELSLRMASLDPHNRRYEKTRKELRKEWKELKKDLHEAERDQRRDETRKQSRKADEKNQKRQRKDGKKVNKILWIVIMPDEEVISSDDDDWDSDEPSEKNKEM